MGSQVWPEVQRQTPAGHVAHLDDDLAIGATQVLAKAALKQIGKRGQIMRQTKWADRRIVPGLTCDKYSHGFYLLVSSSIASSAVSSPVLSRSRTCLRSSAVRDAASPIG